MKDRTSTGAVVKATAHENPRGIPHRYVFGGIDDDTGMPVNYGLTMIALPGFVPPSEFAKHVAACSPLPGDLLQRGPDYRFGVFTYVRRDTGDRVTIEAKDIERLELDLEKAPTPRSREDALRAIDAARRQLKASEPAPKPVRKLPDPDEIPELTPPDVTPPKLPTPTPEKKGLEMSF